jgi:hypothetical protein
VLRSLSLEISESAALDVVAERQQEPFETLQAFKSTDAMVGIARLGGGLGVESQHFEFQALAELGEGRVPLYTLFERDEDGMITVLARDQNPFGRDQNLF